LTTNLTGLGGEAKKGKRGSECQIRKAETQPKIRALWGWLGRKGPKENRFERGKKKGAGSYRERQKGVLMDLTVTGGGAEYVKKRRERRRSY